MRKWLRLGLVLTWSVSAARAVDWKALKPQGYVSDFANVIDPAAKNQLEAYCAAVERSTGGQIALVVIPSLEGEPIPDVAHTIYRGWSVGLKGKQEGVLLLLAVGDQRSRLDIGPGLKATVPGGLDGGVHREMRPALRQRQYGEALMAAAETIGRTIAQAENIADCEFAAAPASGRLRLDPVAGGDRRRAAACLAAARGQAAPLWCCRQRRIWRLRFGKRRLWRMR